MPVLNSRWATDGPRRIPKMVQAPTSAAPTGPSRTAAARVAEELGDQASCRGRSKVAVDSKTTSSRPRTATLRHQRRSPNGPRMISAAARTTTTAIYSRAAHESLAKPSPLTARSVERGLCSNPYPQVLPERAARKARAAITSPPARDIPPDGRIGLTSLTRNYPQLTGYRP